MPPAPTAPDFDRPADRCPGLLRPHTAADGALVRLRLPGGATTADLLRDLAAAAARHGDGDLHLTSRANVQIRGLSGDDAVGGLAADAAALGLLPSPAHERVRNIVASPLSGLAGGRADIRGLAAELDGRLRADRALTALSGRFLFGLDDGRGDIAGLAPDLTAIALDDSRAAVRIGALSGPVVDLASAPAALISLARGFVTLGTDAWRIADLPGAGRELGGADPAETSAPAGPDVSAPPADTAPPSPGFHPGSGARTGAVVALAPLGTLTPEMVAALPDGDVHLSAHRMLAVPAGDDPAALAARLAAAGFVTDPASPWTRVTACIGAPGCAKSAGDTRAAARALVAAGGAETAVHVVGCARSCGAPTRPHSLRVLTAPGPASSGGS